MSKPPPILKATVKGATIWGYPMGMFPGDEEIKTYGTHSCTYEYIERMVLRFGLNSPYPQSNYLDVDSSYSNAFGVIDGVKIHVILHSSKSSEKYMLWTYPDTNELVSRMAHIFESITDLLNEIIARNNQERQFTQS